MRVKVILNDVGELIGVLCSCGRAMTENKRTGRWHCTDGWSIGAREVGGLARIDREGRANDEDVSPNLSS